MAALDAPLRALADENRRAILSVIRKEARPVGEIAESIGVSQQTASHHLKVLKEAGLAESRVEGARRLYAVRTDGLEAVRSYLDEFWPGKLGALKAAAEARASRG